MIMNNDKDASDTTWVQKSQANVMCYESNEPLNRTMSQNQSRPGWRMLFSDCHLAYVWFCILNIHYIKDQYMTMMDHVAFSP